MATLVVHGGCGAPPEPEWQERQAAVERAREAGWVAMGGGALEAVLAAVRRLEDEPWLNAGLGAALNKDQQPELDAGIMEGGHLRVGAVGAVRDVRHPVDLARAVMDDGRYVLIVGAGASGFAREKNIETVDPEFFIAEHRLHPRAPEQDTVGAVARDDSGRLAVAVSTGGMSGKWPGRLGDSPVPGAGFYADDRLGAVCSTGHGEGFLRLVLAYRVAEQMGLGGAPGQVADWALEELKLRTGLKGGFIAIDPRGRPGAAFSTRFMAWAYRVG
ncbi:MAG: isoaspartyl peptidase/L-asparaginase family protein [Candidatus Dormibacteraeota bacterium]|nr:isoaspartyl peptidase/L-asparaginase family protein [Candidatus Dormibacteraeota bacterium]